MTLARVCLGLLLIGACNGDDDGGAAGMSGAGACLMPLDADCTPAFTPSFDEIYSEQIRKSCSLGGGACHGSESGQGGLSLSSADRAYDELLGHADGRARVVPGDPECSILMQRLESMDRDFVMPVGTPMSAGQRCAVQQWIENGAERR
jgi:hypothetical protein